MATVRRRPGDDQPVAQGADLTVLQAVRDAWWEADKARSTRMQKNKRNFHTYLSEQSQAHKQPGQSKEFLPKVPVAIEQLTAVVKRALVQFGDWYSVELDERARQFIQPHEVRSLLNCFLYNIPHGNGTIDFRTLVGDAIKIGALESLLILKIHGRMFTDRVFRAEFGNLAFNGQTGRFEPTETLGTSDRDSWKLQVDLVRPEDYYPDPTGDGLYEIHRVERDLHDVIADAESGIYDIDAVRRIESKMHRRAEQERSDRKRAQDESTPPDWRWRVVIDEYWGTLLNRNGQVAARNIVTAVANNTELIRPPEENPFWHQESPFVVAPLVRVPFSVWHKALFDDASQLNIALNELYNLMLDGGIASVWGIKQLKIDKLKDPSDVSGGIPQGKTLAVDSTVAPGERVLETVSEGQVPRDAMAMFESTNREFTASALTSEVRQGQLPPRQVLATEIVASEQSQAVTLDAIGGDLETQWISKALRKAFLTVLQNADDLAADRILAAIGPNAAFRLARISPAQRFALFNQACQFKVFGISSAMSRVRDFQKSAAAMQLITNNPLLLESFARRFDADEFLDNMFRQLNINPNNMGLSPEAAADLPNRMNRAQGLASLTGGPRGAGGGGPSAEQTGEPGLPAEINQASNPLTGMGAQQ